MKENFRKRINFAISFSLSLGIYTSEKATFWKKVWQLIKRVNKVAKYTVVYIYNIAKYKNAELMVFNSRYNKSNKDY